MASEPEDSSDRGIAPRCLHAQARRYFSFALPSRINMGSVANSAISDPVLRSWRTLHVVGDPRL